MSRPSAAFACLEDHFWDRVDTRGPDECWPWTASQKPPYGYGEVWMRDGSKRLELTHRQAYSLAIGPIPVELSVCHTCDNPPCCNPAHLFVGTDQDNVDDMSAKGRSRHVRGERNHSKLSEPQVYAIRSALAAGRAQSAIAAEFGVGHSTISSIKLGKKWAHLS